jgi:hypothetical protein
MRVGSTGSCAADVFSLLTPGGAQALPLQRYRREFRLGFAFTPPPPGAIHMNVKRKGLREKQFVSI